MEKKCNCCGEYKSEIKFYNNINNKDGKQSYCKKCHILVGKGISVKDLREEYIESSFEKFLGGVSIIILNHVKSGEFRYQMNSTSGKKLYTNDKSIFLKKFNELISKAVE